MPTDFSAGRYNVMRGRGPVAPLIGRVDHDEFVRGSKNELLFRIDGDEFYDMAGNLVGEIVSSGSGGMVVSRGPSGTTCLFTIEEE